MTVESRSLTPQTKSSLHPSEAWLDRRLVLYALAAGATLATATSSQAEVLFTPSNAVLQGPKAALAIDLDHDGSADIIIKLRECPSLAYSYATVPCLVASGAHSTDKIATSAHLFEAAALPKTALIFASLSHSFPFLHRGIMATASDLDFSHWNSVRDRFLGVQLSNGSIHYAWVGFRRVTATGGLRAELAGWAYETQADKGILAGDRGDNPLGVAVPEPTSLEFLAAGHNAINQRRKRTTISGEAH